MIEVALIAALTCSEAAQLIQNVEENALLRPPQHEAVIQTIIDSVPNCDFEENYGNV